MSDEKQRDLPGIPGSPTEEGTPIHGVENLRNAPPLDWGEPGASVPERAAGPAPATKSKTNDPGGKQEQARPARKPRSPNAEETSVREADGGVNEPASRSKVVRKGVASTKPALAAEQTHIQAAIKAAPPSSRPVRRSRKTTTRQAMTGEAQQNKASQTTTVGEGVPPITEEAIAFLRNPNPKAIDIFRLAPDSRAFVEYHITNLQRIEAHGDVTRRALDAAAPRFSPRFEKVVDALLSGRAKQNAIAPMPAADSDRSAPIAMASAAYAPKQLAATVPQPVKVLMGKMEIGTGPSSSEPSPGAVEPRTPPSSARSADAGAPDERVENVIERGTVRERRAPSGDARTGTLRYVAESMPPSSGIDAGIGRRMLRTMSGIVRTTAVWLQSRADKAPAPPPSASSPRLKPATGKRLPGSDDISMPMPEAVAQRFLRVEQNYYFPDRTHAFSDHGNRLATRGSHPEVVRSLVEIAKARGWESITIKGSDEFRRSAWMEAARSGLQVAGYKPTDLDLAELAQRPSSNAVEKGASIEITRTGKPEASITAQGPVPATTPASQKPGSASTDKASGPDPQLAAKAHSFESDKPALAVAKHPDLAPGYGIVDAARKFAEASLPESAREEFIGIARRHVMQKIIAGERVKGPQIYASADKSKDKSEQDRQSAQPNQDMGKPPRAKSAERER